MFNTIDTNCKEHVFTFALLPTLFFYQMIIDSLRLILYVQHSSKGVFLVVDSQKVAIFKLKKTNENPLNHLS